jgi:hypothetical protein
MPNPSTYFLASSIVQKPSPASSPPLIAPTFAGVSTVTANSDGSFTVNWASASGSASTPYSYNIYVALGSVSAATLFQSSNIVQTKLSPAINSRVFQLNDGTYFVQGFTYTFGVRAVSSNGFAETNLVITTSVAIASGNTSALVQNQLDQLQDLADTLTENAKLNTNILVDLAGDDIIIELTEP